MSIVLPEGLPAATALREEGIVVDHAIGAGRALRVALVNLMPDRSTTETQFARVLGASRHRVELMLTLPPDMPVRRGDSAHCARHYRPWHEIERSAPDAVIVTGAPLERLPFHEVRYWDGLCHVLDWARRGAVPSWFVCWAAQAALWHRHGVPKHLLAEKAFGVFSHPVSAYGARLLSGIGDGLVTPVSRHSRTDAADLRGLPALRVLAARADSGLCLADEPATRAVYMLNHPEYDADTLRREYLRDRVAGRPVRPPEGYFPHGGLAAEPVAFWRPQAVRLFQNWLEEVAGGYRVAAKKSCIVRSMKAMSCGRRKDAAM